MKESMIMVARTMTTTGDDDDDANDDTDDADDLRDEEEEAESRSEVDLAPRIKVGADSPQQIKLSS